MRNNLENERNTKVVDNMVLNSSHLTSAHPKSDVVHRLIEALCPLLGEQTVPTHPLPATNVPPPLGVK